MALPHAREHDTHVTAKGIATKVCGIQKFNKVQLFRRYVSEKRTIKGTAKG
jgi:hypothetical protein